MIEILVRGNRTAARVLYGLPVTRISRTCAVGWYVPPREGSPREIRSRKRVLPTSFDRLEYRAPDFPFDSYSAGISAAVKTESNVKSQSRLA